jgi:hypothetical protein
MSILRLLFGLILFHMVRVVAFQAATVANIGLDSEIRDPNLFAERASQCDVRNGNWLQKQGLHAWQPSCL